jgi:hypothetical protein|tara:strand:+ start:974 stop:1153 length:180 start_codon:yes stop_codon:yes gene_type:complete
VPKKNKTPDASINKGIELMLRRDNINTTPKKGMGFNKAFSIFNRNWYFNIELRWESNKI